MTDDLSDVTRNLSTLLLFPKQWIHRRVESVEILDDQRIRRYITVDFTIQPTDFGEQECIQVPLTLMQKERHASRTAPTKSNRLHEFSLRDEGGRAVPLATREEASQLELGVLNVATDSVLRHSQRPLHTMEMLAPLLRDLVCEPSHVAGPLLVSLRDDYSLWQDPPCNLQTDLDWARSYLRTLAIDFAYRYYLFVPIERANAGRRIIKMTYEDEFYRERSDKTLRNRLPITLPNVGGASSYHCRVAAPRDLMFRGPLNVVLEDPERTGICERDFSDEEVSIYAHSVSRGGKITVYCNFDLYPTGFAQIGSYVPLSVFAILTLGLLIKLGTTARPDVAGTPAVLVVFPALFAPYMLYEGGHRLATKFARRVQRAVVLSTAFSLIAAGSLAVTWDQRVPVPSNPGWRVSLWILLWCLTLALLCMMAARLQGRWPVVRTVAARMKSLLRWTSIELSTSRVLCGGKVIVTGSQFAAWETVSIMLAPSVERGLERLDLAHVNSDSSGAFETTVLIPHAGLAGSCEIQKVGSLSHRFAWAHIGLQATASDGRNDYER